MILCKPRWEPSPPFGFIRILPRGKSISSKTTVFLLLTAGIIFIALLFYTFETLLVFAVIYFISIPLSILIYKNQEKKYTSKISDEDHEDIL